MVAAGCDTAQAGTLFVAAGCGTEHARTLLVAVGSDTEQARSDAAQTRLLAEPAGGGEQPAGVNTEQARSDTARTSPGAGQAGSANPPTGSGASRTGSGTCPTGTGGGRGAEKTTRRHGNTEGARKGAGNRGGGPGNETTCHCEAPQGPEKSTTLRAGARLTPLAAEVAGNAPRLV